MTDFSLRPRRSGGDRARARYFLFCGATAISIRAVVNPIIETLEGLGFTLWHDALERTDVLLRGIAEFREHLGAT